MKLWYNANIVLEDRTISGYLTAIDGTIEVIEEGSPSEDMLKNANELVDCAGNYLLPGFIDTHV